MAKYSRIPRKKKKRMKTKVLMETAEWNPKKCILRTLEDDGANFEIFY